MKLLKAYIETNGFYSNYSRAVVLFKHLEKLGYDIKFFWVDVGKSNNIFLDKKTLKESDLVYFQTPFIHHLFERGPKYIWDLDDILETKELHREEDIENIKIEMKRCFNKIDGVIFGSKLMQEHYADWHNLKYQIAIDDYIDPCNHKARNKKINDGRVKIGFFGSRSYDKELKDLVPIINQLRENYAISFTVIGVDSARNLLLKNHHKHIPYNRNFDYFNRILAEQGFDIGLVYYIPRDVTLPKTHLKFSEFSWLGIPCVASRWITGQYIPENIAILYDNKDEIEYSLEKLIVNKNRAELGREAQKYVKKHFSLHNQLEKYDKFFKEVINGN